MRTGSDTIGHYDEQRRENHAQIYRVAMIPCNDIGTLMNFRSTMNALTFCSCISHKTTRSPLDKVVYSHVYQIKVTRKRYSIAVHLTYQILTELRRGQNADITALRYQVAAVVPRRTTTPTLPTIAT